MDQQSFAFLDKSQIKVMCGNCRKRIASVHEVSHPAVFEKQVPPGPHKLKRIFTEDGKAYYRVVFNGVGRLYPLTREVIIPWAYRLHEDGMWRMSERAKRRLKSGRTPAVRRQDKVNRFHDLASTLHTPTAAKTGQNSIKAERTSEDEEPILLPIRVECLWCSSVQRLELNSLKLTQERVLMGTDTGQWRSKHWPGFPDIPPERMIRDDGLPFNCIRVVHDDNNPNQFFVEKAH